MDFSECFDVLLNVEWKMWFLTLDPPKNHKICGIRLKSMGFVVFWGKIDVSPLVPLSGLKTNQQFCSFKLKNLQEHSF